MIKEAYVSFEVAKLLNEKGFNWSTQYVYTLDGTGSTPPKIGNWRAKSNIQKPTLQMAMRWLREVHNLFIELRVGETNGKTRYDFDIIPINRRKIVWNHYDSFPFVECNSYEEAVEAAIKYCLENSI